MQCRNGNSGTGTKLIALICVLAVSFFAFTLDLHAEPNQAGSKQAVLYVSVVVMPSVQAFNLTPALPPHSSIAYSLETTHQEKRYEVRSFPPAAAVHSDKQASAILKTLVVVPE